MASTSSKPSQPPTDRASVPIYQQPGPRIFFAGLAFAVFSSISTRRALIRRRTPVAQMPAEARAQFTKSLKQQQQAGAPAHVSTPHPTSTPGAGAGRPTPLHTTGQTSQAAHTARGANAAAEAQAAAEAAAPELHNSGAILALEALALATVNVFSWGITSVGGAAWYLDVRSLDELRVLLRSGMGSDAEVEEEMEEWVAGVLARKDAKGAARAAGKVLVTDAQGRVRAVDARVLEDLDEEEPKKKKTGWLW